MLHHHITSVLSPLSSVLSLLSSVLSLLSSVFCPLSSLFCPLSSLFCLLSSLFCPLSSVLSLLSSVFCLLSSLLCPLLCPLSSLFCPPPTGQQSEACRRCVDVHLPHTSGLSLRHFRVLKPAEFIVSCVEAAALWRHMAALFITPLPRDICAPSDWPESHVTRNMASCAAHQNSTYLSHSHTVSLSCLSHSHTGLTLISAFLIISLDLFQLSPH